MKRYALIFTFLFSGAVVHALTLSQIRTDVRRNLRDTDATRQRYTDAVLLDFINEAQREVVNATWLVEETSSYILTPFTTFYILPNKVIAVTHAEFKNRGNSTTPLIEKTRKGLGSDNPDWKRGSGEPSEYFIDISSDSDQLTISYIPIPIVTSTGTVTLWFVVQIDDLAADGDVPFNGKRALYTHHNCLTFWATARIKAIERKVDESTFYFQLFGNCVEVTRNKANARPNYTPGIQAGGSGR